MAPKDMFDRTFRVGKIREYHKRKISNKYFDCIPFLFEELPMNNVQAISVFG